MMRSAKLFTALTRSSSLSVHGQTRYYAGRPKTFLDAKSALAGLAEKLGVRKLEDWYHVRMRDIDLIADAQQKLLVRRHRRSIASVLESNIPQHKWQSWRFSIPPRSFYADVQAQRAAIKWLGRELGIRSPEHWYAVTEKALAPYPGIQALLRLKYHKSLPEALQTLLTDINWDSSKFVWGSEKNVFDQALVPWRDLAVRKQFLDSYGSTKLGITNFKSAKELERWYSVTNRHIDEAGAGHMLRYIYAGSLCKALQEVYPHHEWLRWRFAATPRGYWLNKDNCREFLEWLAAQLKLDVAQRPELWFKITTQHIHDNGGAGILDKYGKSMLSVLRAAYPDQDWSPSAPFSATSRQPDFWQNVEQRTDH